MYHYKKLSQGEIGKKRVLTKSSAMHCSLYTTMSNFACVHVAAENTRSHSIDFTKE